MTLSTTVTLLAVTDPDELQTIRVMVTGVPVSKYPEVGPPVVLVREMLGGTVVGVTVGVRVMVEVGAGDPPVQPATGVARNCWTAVPQLVGVKFQSEIRSGQEPLVKDHAVHPTIPLVPVTQVKKLESKLVMSPELGGQVASGPNSPTKTG